VRVDCHVQHRCDKADDKAIEAENRQATAPNRNPHNNARRAKLAATGNPTKSPRGKSNEKRPEVAFETDRWDARGNGCRPLKPQRFSTGVPPRLFTFGSREAVADLWPVE
jgi:hypothetical protein